MNAFQACVAESFETVGLPFLSFASVGRSALGCYKDHIAVRDNSLLVRYKRRLNCSCLKKYPMVFFFFERAEELTLKMIPVFISREQQTCGHIFKF